MKGIIMEVVKPICVEKIEKDQKKSAWLTIWPLTLLIFALWMLIDSIKKVDILQTMLWAAVVLCCLVAGASYLAGSSQDKKVTAQKYDEAFDDFVEAFGDNPTDNHDTTQIMVDSVLSCMKCSVQGHLERVLGAKRKHDLLMTSHTAKSLAKKREEAEDSQDDLNDAVASALDWRYTVPEGVQDFEKK